MACRRLVKVPKTVLQRLYLQPPVASVVSSHLASKASAPFALTLRRCASSESAAEIPAIPEFRDNIFRRMRRKIGLPDYSNAYYRAMAVFIYEKIDTLAVNDIFEEFQLEDSFYSWFLVMELHLWMLLSRASRHGKEGRIIKECLGKTMWEDVRRRIKLVVKDLSLSDQSKTMSNLSSEMDFAIVLYDEAVSSDDRRLAEALWVRLYRAGTVDPIVLEKVVCYVRKQIRHLDLIPREQWILRANFTWLSLKDCRI